MLRKVLIAFALICVSVSSISAWANDVQFIRVNDVRIGEHPQKTRVVLDLSGPTEAKMFSLGDPARLVVDISRGDWAVPFQSGTRGGGAISSIRYGRLNEGMARLVLDLAYPVELASSEVIHASGQGGTRLVLDLVQVSPAVFAANVKRPKSAIQNRPSQVPQAAETAAAEPPVTEPPAPKAPVVLEPTPPETVNSVQIEPIEKPESAPVVLDEVPATAQAESARFVIVIDAGHGGRDPGAIGSQGTKEADVVLKAAKELKAQLDKKKRYKTVLTRVGNTSMKLRNRIAVARDANANLFISLHADSLPDAGKVRGASAYTLSKKASDAEAGALARKENQADVLLGVDLTEHSSEVNDILIDLALNHTKNASVRFAGMLTTELGRVTPLVKSPQKSAGFVVLKSPDVPSVLLELGFLSNVNDEKNLNSTAWRKKTATAIATAIDQYFGYAEVSQIGG